MRGSDARGPGALNEVILLMKSRRKRVTRDREGKKRARTEERGTKGQRNNQIYMSKYLK